MIIKISRKNGTFPLNHYLNYTQGLSILYVHTYNNVIMFIVLYNKEKFFCI
jgi:hypothetical protein